LLKLLPTSFDCTDEVFHEASCAELGLQVTYNLMRGLGSLLLSKALYNTK